MKVAHTTGKSFKPFTITVESQAEGDLLVALLGATSDFVAAVAGLPSKEVYEMYEKLCEYSEPRGLPIVVSLSNK